jgi:hypothetical protein
MHCILIPLYFVLFVWVKNIGEVDPLLTIIPMVVLVLLSVLLRLIVGFVLEKLAANILITCFWWLFFTYESLYSSVKDVIFLLYPKLEFQGRVAWDLPLILLIIELGALGILFRTLSVWANSKRIGTGVITKLNSFFNGMTAFLCFYLVCTLLVSSYWAPARKLSAVRAGLSAENLAPEARAEENAQASQVALPNIYHLIVDGYGRQDVLLNQLAFDNSPFIEFLERAGFTVLKDSWANYSITQASLTSTLNLDYFDNVLRESGGQSIDGSSVTRAFAIQAIRNNRLIKFLKSVGYHYLHIGSIWEATIRNPNADEEYGCSRFNLQNEFIRALVARSWLAPFEQVGGASIARCHIRMFSNLTDIAQSYKRQPYYVFAHMVLPHYPYVFNDDCSVKSQVEMSNAFSLRKELWTDATSYIDQVKCVNSMLVNALNVIIKQNPNSWIILHSDHGPDIPRLSGIHRVAARLANLIAVRAPEGREINADFHSPLGAWRRIAGALTRTNLDIVERYYYIPDEESGNILSWREFKIEELRQAQQVE